MTTFRDGDFQRKSTEFLTWLRKLRGASVSSKIHIADMRSRKAGRGIIALDDIEENEELFCIRPTDLLTVQNSTLSKRIPDVFNKLDSWMSLILVLIYEVGQEENSKWWPYLQILPEYFDTLMFWSSLELAELQGSSVIAKIGKDDADRSFVDSLLPLVQDYNSLFGKFASVFDSIRGEEALLEVAHRMATLIMAYAFDIEENDGSDDGCDDNPSTLHGSSKAMIPLADMFNADGDMINAHLLQQGFLMTMVASKETKKGQEIFNDYGQRPRSDLLRRYGYITDNAKIWDIVELDSVELQLVKDWDVLEVGYDLRRQSHREIFEFPTALVLVIHAYTMNGDAFNAAAMAGDVPDKMQLSRNVASVLTKIIVSRFKSYSTSIAQDMVLLSNSELDGRRRMAIEVRLGEKEILAVALDSARARIEALNQKDLAVTSDQESTQETTAKKKRW
ncbi:hypothetical protein MMC07_007613 [Pseudocyphellaria aurata]|nr:hypothetical protein [Pseudocyphellaria aurata]